MAADEENEKIWQDVRDTPMSIKLDFTDAVEEHFKCSTCQDLPYKPVTTECKHNVCLSCLKRAFKNDYTNCPACRADLKDESQDVNEKLQAALSNIMVGYEGSRD